MEPRLRPYINCLNSLKNYITTKDNRTVIQDNISYITGETRHTFNVLLKILGVPEGERNPSAKDEEIKQLYRALHEREAYINELKAGNNELIEQIKELRGSNNNYEIGSHGTLIAPNSQNNGNNWVEPVKENEEPSSPSSGKFSRNELERITHLNERQRPLFTMNQYSQVTNMDAKIMKGPPPPGKKRKIVPRKTRKGRRRA